MVVSNTIVYAYLPAPATDRMPYTPHSRLRTRKAADEAVRLVESIVASPGAGRDRGDDTGLFLALHTCAYRAAGRGRRKPVPAEELVKWARRWRIVRDYIVEQNLGLAYSMLGRFHSDHADLDELRSEALFALVRAVAGFNPWRGFRFSTYACNAIIRSLIQEARRAGRHRLRFAVGLETGSQEPHQHDRRSELYADRLHQAMDLNLGELTDRESAVLAGRFPMDSSQGLTLGQVGNTLGLSKERVRQIQNRALGKLREVLEADPILQ